jgi:hypothetical protein
MSILHETTFQGETMLKYDGLIDVSRLISSKESGQNLDISKFFSHKRGVI